MRGVIQNASGFANGVCGVNVCDGGKGYPDDLFSCPHYRLQGLVGPSWCSWCKPSSDAAAKVLSIVPSVVSTKTGG